MSHTRDQKRAAHAYRCVASVPSEQRKDYKVLVNDFGANVMRSGLCAALAFVQRKHKDGDDGDSGGKSRNSAADTFIEHLAGAGLPGIARGENDLMAHVQRLTVHPYMLATREVLALSLWFRRAVQALMPDVSQGGR